MPDRFDEMAAEIAAAHKHECSEWKTLGTCTSDMCVCECGAMLMPGEDFPADPRWFWVTMDGEYDPFPDVRDSEAEEGRTKYG